MSSGVAAFDFDGTIARRDTLVPFLYRWNRLRFGPDIAVCALAVARHSGDRRDAFKRAVMARLFAGVAASELERHGARYAAGLPRLYRRDTLERVAWHAGRGHRLILVTGSLGAYVRPAATALGFDEVIATELAADDSGVLTGELDGANVRGPEKAHLLGALLGSDPATELWAYGDSGGDREMLAMADHPTWVGRRAGPN